jgi:Fe-S-cluster-containing hydrogenase component 2
VIAMNFPFPRHDRTAHVRLDLRRCQACGDCAEACPRGVLSLLPYRWHRHAHVDHADRCKGCLRCVDACEHGAILARRPSPQRRATAGTRSPEQGNGAARNALTRRP